MDDIDEYMDDPYTRAGLLDYYEHERARLAALEPIEDPEPAGLSCDHPGRTGP